jgi:glycerate 2-kinase
LAIAPERSDEPEPPILVAPDAFKGTFTAPEVAEALAAGIREAGRPASPLPIADGGEGTAQVLARALGGELREAPCTDPLGRQITAEYALMPSDETAIVDVAAASGLTRLRPEEYDPWAASTAGTGELIAAAARAGARTVVVGAGGSATVDGGLGAIRALTASGSVPRLIVACDARTSWEHAAAVYGPQKGADPELVERLARLLDRLASRAPRDPRGVAMTGCAGGLSGGLWAFFDATLRPGADYVLDAVGFDRALAASASVITGEGRIDAQTLEGKAVGVVSARAGRSGIPCDAVVGVDLLRAGERERLGLRHVLEARTPAELRAAGARLARAE